MSRIKELLIEAEVKQRRKIEGYRKHLIKEDTYEMDCPYCLGALSKYDAKKEQCVHCGYVFKWKS